VEGSSSDVRAQNNSVVSVSLPILGSILETKSAVFMRRRREEGVSARQGEGVTHPMQGPLRKVLYTPYKYRTVLPNQG